MITISPKTSRIKHRSKQKSLLPTNSSLYVLKEEKHNPKAGEANYRTDLCISSGVTLAVATESFAYAKSLEHGHGIHTLSTIGGVGGVLGKIFTRMADSNRHTDILNKSHDAFTQN